LLEFDDVFESVIAVIYVKIELAFSLSFAELLFNALRADFYINRR
jgi:hypothetical protein